MQYLDIAKEKNQLYSFISKIFTINNQTKTEKEVELKIKKWEDIKKKLTGYVDSVNTYTKQLEAKKKEAENLLNKAVDDAKNKATDTAKKAADDATKKATDAAKDKLKGFLR